MEYGGTITLPPDDVYESLEIIKVKNLPEYAIDFDLWINGEHSDLTLSCTIHMKEDQTMTIEIDDLHVL